MIRDVNNVSSTESLNRFTCIHDYLHETLLHRIDCIYRSHYGGLLQPFQCHLKYKGITGDPSSRKSQLHEAFLHLVDDALRWVPLNQYLLVCDPVIFERVQGESKIEFLTRVDRLYEDWCNGWNDDLDEPTNAVNL